MSDDFIPYPANNADGFIPVYEGDGVVVLRPDKAFHPVTRGISPTLMCDARGCGAGVVLRDGSTRTLRIRKLTERECWRLMGFPDESFERARDAGTSRAQLCVQAGNSIVVDCLMAIFDGMYRKGSWSRACTLYDFCEGGAVVE